MCVMKRIFPVLLSLVIFVPLGLLFGQERHFINLNVQEGLSQSGVLDIKQDKYGFIWLATRYGLNRYDGARFKVYTHDAQNPNTLSGDYITTLHFDRVGRLWIGSGVGLDLYDEKLDRFIRIPLPNYKNTPKDKFVLCIYEDQKGHLWVATDAGLYWLKDADINGRFQKIEEVLIQKQDIGSAFWTIFQDAKKQVWVSSEKGLFRMAYDGSKLRVLPNPIFAKRPYSVVRAISEDGAGNIWFGTEAEGLLCLNNMTHELKRYAKSTDGTNGLVNNNVRDILSLENGSLAIGTQGGLSILDITNRQFTNYKHNSKQGNSLSQNSIYSLFQDRQGSLWVGTYFGGVNISYAGLTRFHDLFTENDALGDKHQVVRAISSDRDGDIWIGSEGGGLSRWNPRLNSLVHYDLTQGNSLQIAGLVKTVLLDRQQDVWVGTSNAGLKYIDRQTGKIKSYTLGLDDYQLKRSAIVALYEDRNENLWVGGLGHNKIYQKQGEELKDITPAPIRQALQNRYIVSIQEGKDKQLWILTDSTLFRYNFSENSLQAVFEGGKFNSLAQDRAGLLWLGKYYGGLIGYDPQKSKVVYQFKHSDGLSHDNVVGIVEDAEQSLWIATQSGLNKLSKDRKRLRSFTGLDGVRSEEFNYNAIHRMENRLYVGSLNGLVYFNVDEVAEDRRPDKVVFSGVRLFNGVLEQPLSGHQLLTANTLDHPELSFSADQNIFTFEFSLLSYIKSAKNRYAYQLSGISDLWTYSESGQATFTNLPAGSYTLLVRGQNNDGLWSEPTAIVFEVLPPLWKTWWAYTLYLLVLSGIVYMLFLFFHRRAIQAKEEQLHKFKLNFFTNVSHEIRSHLTLITVPIDNAVNLLQQEGPLSDAIRQAKESGSRLLKLVNELMDFRKAESSQLVMQKKTVALSTFLTPIVKSFQQIAIDRGIDFHYLDTALPILVELDGFQFEKVIFNLLTNAVKYTGDLGTIYVEVISEGPNVTISVRNTGKGIESEYFERIFDNYFQIDKKDQETGYGIGLALSRHIVQLHGGDIRVESKDGETTFFVKLPCSTADVATDLLSEDIVFSKPLEHPSNVQHDEAISRSKILVVEDNPALTALLIDMLNHLYEIHTAEDGEEGVLRAHSIMPDLIISDIMMPKRNGFDLCEMLKTDTITSHIPVILLTALTSEADQVSGLTSRADAYLTKPYHRDILLLHVRNLLESRAQIQQKYRQEFVIGPRNMVINTMDEEFLNRFIEAIENGLDSGEFDVEHLSDKMAMSQSVLYKKIRALTGMTINDFSKSIRLKRAAALLEQRNYSVSEVSLMVGFMDSKYFGREFKKHFGVSPSQYGHKNK